MATKIWQGGAPAVAQVQDYVFTGTWEAGDIIQCTIGDVAISLAAGSTTKATIVDLIVSTWNALSATQYPQFAEITASRTGDTLRLTADTAGKPFACTLLTTEAGGGAADDQLIDGGTSSVGVATVANAGPNDWSTAANWDTNAVPVNTNDVILENSSVSILYGLAQSAVTLASLTIRKSFTGYLGLPRNAALYPEYREQYLCIGATICLIGQGAGTGSGRIKVNFGSVQTACTVYGSGGSAEANIPAVLLQGTHAANVLTVLDGDVGVAFFGGETAVVATLTQAGGTLRINANLTTANVNGGQCTIGGTATVATLNANGGTTYYTSSGTCTAANIAAAVDCSADSRARFFSTTKLFKGAVLRDPGKSITHTNGLALQNCRLADVSLDVGYGRTITLTA